ncbi:hypothetical protein [Hydrogenophaga sp.]|jgi:hypothetical protein|uniref:hypothetical protein n=1 Tax=Hydrogenophaga sp. TaxID=1904254 RepID=UPI003F71507A
MDDTDAFFTQTIVGPPLSVLLGRQLDAQRLAEQGLDVNLASGEARLTARWQEWILLGHSASSLGKPRQRPGVWRRRLERHALWFACLGMLSLLLSAGFWAAAIYR